MESMKQRNLSEIVESLLELTNQERDIIFEYLGRHVNESPTKLEEQASINSILESLTERQKEVLTLVASGYTRREISASLGISISTAASHIRDIYNRLNITSKADATRIAFDLGLLKSSVINVDFNANHCRKSH